MLFETQKSVCGHGWRRASLQRSPNPIANFWGSRSGESKGRKKEGAKDEEKGREWKGMEGNEEKRFVWLVGMSGMDDHMFDRRLIDAQHWKNYVAILWRNWAWRRRSGVLSILNHPRFSTIIDWYQLYQVLIRQVAAPFSVQVWDVWSLLVRHTNQWCKQYFFQDRYEDFSYSIKRFNILTSLTD